MKSNEILKQPISQIDKTVAMLSSEKQKQIITKLKIDTRSGAKKIAEKIEKRLFKEQAKNDAYEKLFSLEENIYNQGFNRIAGVDEAGRGPLAGPLVAAAVVLPRDKTIPGLKDSKQLSEKKREYFYEKVLEIALDYTVKVYDNKAIDSVGVHKVNLTALETAAEKLAPKADFVLVDGYKLKSMQTSNLRVIKGDMVSASIAAASVIAKVSRDRMMLEYHKKYPRYGFDSHKGYGSSSHYEALKVHGLTPIHRTSFQGLEKFRKI